MLKISRKQIETRLKVARKTLSDAEKAFRESQQPCTSALLTTNGAISLPEVSQQEDIGGVWSIFNIDRAQRELGAIIDSCGIVTDQPPFKISAVLQLPASLRLNITSVRAKSSL